MTVDHLPGRLMPNCCPTGKHVYESEKYALRAIRFMREHGEARRANPYKCIACKGWHVTSQSRLRKVK